MCSNVRCCVIVLATKSWRETTAVCIAQIFAWLIGTCLLSLAHPQGVNSLAISDFIIQFLTLPLGVLDSMSCDVLFHPSPDVAGGRGSGIPRQVTDLQYLRWAAALEGRR